MLNFLHTFTPDPILIALGSIKIHWYGLLIVLGILSAMMVTIKLANYYKLNKNFIIDASFWIIIWGIAGARLYHVALELPYYLSHPLEIFMVWHGGLAIHGAIIAGLAVMWHYGQKIYTQAESNPTGPIKLSRTANLIRLASLFAPGLALAQAIGRFGNYFNQELYGLPTSLPWGIPIQPEFRNLAYYDYQYFHPTFLYESLGNILIFMCLIFIHRYIIKYKLENKLHFLPFISYLILYSLLRFSTEFIRIDLTPEFLSLRWPQIISIIIIIISLIYVIFQVKNKTPQTLEKN